MATQTADLRETAMVALRQPSLCAAFQLTAAANADRPALRTPDDSVSLTWRQYAERVRSIAAGLAALGVGDGDTVALLLANRPEFHLFDTAALHLGAAPFSVYHTNPPDLIRHLLENSDTPVLVTEQAFLEQARESRALHDGAVQLVVVDGPGADDYMTLEELESRGNPDFDFEAAWRAVGPDHLATIVYTSGTTGPPKGVQHSHRVLMFHLNSIDRLAPISPEGRVVSYLPMAHIAERFISHYSSVAFGYTITCCANPKELPKAIATTRPTRFFGVPRIYEKLRAAALGAVEADPSGPLARALEAGIARVRAEQAGEQAPAVSEEHERTFAALREKLGLDQVEWVGVAAAPTPYAVLEFFHAIGVPVAELWGMSECLLSTSNPPARIKLGTVGTARPDTEVRISPDGEILLRGPHVFLGYYRNPARTAETVVDGWLRTGDVGRLDADGFLTITDRMKDIIITAGGKNVTPSEIENQLKFSPFIADAVVIGDQRKFLCCLVMIDHETVAQFAQERSVPFTNFASLCRAKEVQDLIWTEIERVNRQLARVETIKTFRLIEQILTAEDEELTPTMKLKRALVNSKYKDVIDEMYAAR